MTEEKILQKIEELRGDADNSLPVACHIISQASKKHLEDALKAKDFFKDQEKYSEETITYYKKEYEKAEKIYFLLRDITSQIMTVQKEKWVPINDLVKELYDLRKENR